MNKMLNPRSVLHALDPIGLGTGEVESLLSYFCRLAVSHSTSTLGLSRAIAQRFEYEVEAEFDWFHRQLSGIGESAMTWSSALSALTSTPRLDRLTFLPWRHVIAQNGLPIVTKGQFCPHCLADDLANGQTPYFRLAWESKSVTACHRHSVRLSQHCPCCGKDNVRHAAAIVVPGWCTKCGSFLASGSHGDNAAPVEPAELWRARQVHELVLAQQKLTLEPTRQAWVEAIEHIVDEMDGGQGARFASRVGFSKGTVHYWLQSDKTATLDASLQVALLSGMGLAQLLTGQTTDWVPPNTGQQMMLAIFKRQATPRVVRRDIDWVELEAKLQSFLNQPTPIPVREIARQLDVEPRQLYLNANQTTRKLGERWLAYAKRRRLANLEKAMPMLEAAGREVLMEGKGINLREMAARVPDGVLSNVQGLYDVIRDMKGRITAAPDLGTDCVVKSPSRLQSAN